MEGEATAGLLRGQTAALGIDPLQWYLRPEPGFQWGASAAEARVRAWLPCGESGGPLRKQSASTEEEGMDFG